MSALLPLRKINRACDQLPKLCPYGKSPHCFGMPRTLCKISDYDLGLFHFPVKIKLHDCQLWQGEKLTLADARASCMAVEFLVGAMPSS